MESILLTLLEKIGWPVASMVIVWLCGKYLDKYAKMLSRPTAETVAKIVDEVLDVLTAAFPNASWDDMLAKLVRAIMDKLGLKKQNAIDVAQAAMLKRGLKPPSPSTIVVR